MARVVVITSPRALSWPSGVWSQAETLLYPIVIATKSRSYAWPVSPLAHSLLGLRTRSGGRRVGNLGRLPPRNGSILRWRQLPRAPRKRERDPSPLLHRCAGDR